MKSRLIYILHPATLKGLRRVLEQSWLTSCKKGVKIPVNKIKILDRDENTWLSASKICDLESP